MLKGVNTLQLNPATVMQAVQDYLNKQLIKSVVVTGISSANGVFYVTVKNAFEEAA